MTTFLIELILCSFVSLMIVGLILLIWPKSRSAIFERIGMGLGVGLAVAITQEFMRRGLPLWWQLVVIGIGVLVGSLLGQWVDRRRASRTNRSSQPQSADRARGG